jgi:hypothetical protein
LLVFRWTTSITNGSIETELTKIRGRQPSLWIARNAWIVCVGSAKIMIVSAFDAFRRAICELRSGSVRSYVWTAVMRVESFPSPRRSPTNMSCPYSESSWRTAILAFGRVRATYRP